MSKKSLRFKQITSAGTAFTDLGQTVGVIELFGLTEEGRVYKFNTQDESWEPVNMDLIP